jgi:hypothetical protein
MIDGHSDPFQDRPQPVTGSGERDLIEIVTRRPLLGAPLGLAQD